MFDVKFENGPIAALVYITVNEKCTKNSKFLIASGNNV